CCRAVPARRALDNPEAVVAAGEEAVAGQAGVPDRGRPRGGTDPHAVGETPAGATGRVVLGRAGPERDGRGFAGAEAAGTRTAAGPDTGRFGDERGAREPGVSEGGNREQGARADAGAAQAAGRTLIAGRRHGRTAVPRGRQE